jgi:fimbrial chaperone protein
MTARHLLLSILASAAAFGLPPVQALGGTFSISPVGAELSAAAQTEAFTLRNQEDAPVVVQAEMFAWEQSGGEDRLTPTRDVLVSPAVFTIPGNGSQLVRVALRRPVDGQRELSYRLLLTEVPQKTESTVTGLNMALRLSLPVFVAPQALTAARLEWTVAPGDAGIPLTARNTGNAHARVLSFSVTPAGATAPVMQQNVATYVLPGQARTWTLDNKNDPAAASTEWRRLRVTGSTEAGDFEVEARPEEP